MMSRLPEYFLNDFFSELWPFEKFDILNLSARYLDRGLNLGQRIGDDD